jgi:filamentous hemagglutinin family protein
MSSSFRNLLLTSTALLALGLAPSVAGPRDPQIIGGTATVLGAGTGNVTINQSSDKAIINWSSFNIGAGETTRFNQPGSNSVVLNRVTGGLGATEIYGTLLANGHVYVINRDGFLFGAGAVINTGGFLATTADIRNDDFMAGRYRFNIPGRPDASIVNLGSITAANGGFAALVAPGVRNSGTISATLGTVTLAAGNTFTLDFYGDRLITLGINDAIAANVIDVATGKPLKSLIANEGTLKANGGRVELTAAAARQIVDSVINTSGVIEANTIGQNKGMIVLGAATASGKPDGAPKQTVKIAGLISAAGKQPGQKGGTVVISGENIEVTGASIDASGRAGGGTVLIGGDWGGGRPNRSLVNHPGATLESFAVPTASTVNVDAGTTINASAIDSGNGGKVILWADDVMKYSGTILAKGGLTSGDDAPVMAVPYTSGKGGFVETSGKSLQISGSIAAGIGGLWLLDPNDLTVDSTLAGAIQAALNGGSDVTHTTTSGPGIGAGDINVMSSISWFSSATLTFSAFHDIKLFDGVEIKNTGAGNLKLRADNEGNGSGTINFQQFTMGSRVNWTGSTGKVDFYYNPASYTSPVDFTPAGQGGGTRGVTFASASQFTAYMLVNTVAQLQTISQNLSGNYALNNNLNLISISSFTPLGQFAGKFDGLDHTISNLTIAPNDSTTRNIGLFNTIEATGVVRNLHLTNVNVHANPGFNSSIISQWVGAVAGTNAGTIDNVTAHGKVQGGSIIGVVAGGLVGQNGFLGPHNVAGTITGSQANVTVSVGDGGSACPGVPCSFNVAGGLVGANVADSNISTSSAQGNVSAGLFATAGGLVGSNGFGNFTNGFIVNSSATGNVTITGQGNAGGLVGYNGVGSTILDSQALGDVSSSMSGFQTTALGGFAGVNQGLISGSSVPPVGTACAVGASWSCAKGAVQVGSQGLAGGFVGYHDGILLNVFATGNVTGAAGTINRSTLLGGLAGASQGTIVNAYATGNVGTVNVPFLVAGGLVADNGGTIGNSFATGNVFAGDHSQAGGLTGDNTPFNTACIGCIVGIGFNNLATIVTSGASGNVTVGADSVAGGLTATSKNGFFALTSATGNVSGGADSILGGFAGAIVGSVITHSDASGAVSSSGANSWIGGFVGVNAGYIQVSTSSGPVSGTSDSMIGGFAGLNLGFIQSASTAPTATVTGTGSNNFVGGFAGVNFGAIDQSTSAGNATSGANSVVGGFIGANATFVNLPANQLPFSTFPTGTSTNSSGSGTATGGPGSTTGSQVARSDPTSLPASPQSFNGCGEQICDSYRSGQLGQSSNNDNTNDAPPQNQQINDIKQEPPPASDPPPPVVTTQAVTQPQQQTQQPQPQGARDRIPGQIDAGPGRFFFVPPLGETAFIKNEVLLQIDSNVSPERLQLITRQLGLSVIGSQRLDLIGKTAYQFRLPQGVTVAQVIQRLASFQVVNGAQPVYVFQTQQQQPEPAAIPQQQPGDAAQYVPSKLRLSDIHRLVKGANIRVAVIDSAIDFSHPDLQDAIADRFDAAGPGGKPHLHGTGMAGAIAAQRRLMGVAPGARLLAVNAFSGGAGSAESTTLNILKGLEWAVANNARIINMSFAGPRDPSLERALQTAYDRGVVLIAAAGNAGNSRPLYPAADKNVIAVTATDIDDKLFTRANRGNHVAIAAPGVDIFVPAPEGTYQMTTGTSVATAHVSGIVALLLERNPALKPADIRRILMASAKRLGPNDQFGAGLVDPARALQLADPKTVQQSEPAPR